MDPPSLINTLILNFNHSSILKHIYINIYLGMSDIDESIYLGLDYWNVLIQLV